PPLYRLSHNGKTVYALDDAQRDSLRTSEFHANAKVDVGRFKGLGEMNARDLKETTMDPTTRQLAKVTLPEDFSDATDLFGRLMGKKAEPRFQFIQDNAAFARESLDV
ncbi:MAG: DNA topoisomerase IV subunit B, partial [Pseudomonadota bacterium]